ncbi:glycosyltransferase [Herbiconiux sp. L3-i23]|uniref:glycosyltransferase n=1 Tax=Herbiconiux sp. L3-i23 TaxID=2905871 RepID=UPI002067EF16|nr:glycosyltransferase [Herbiconiux sp. L3-i23]BDI21619.1 glycosyl transferase [Herbiconiux sp. L3-i23]
MNALSTLLQRVIFPRDHDPALVPLYVDADHWSSLPVYRDERTIRSERGFVHDEQENSILRLSDDTRTSAFIGDGGFAVEGGRHVSFGSYFNAFPAAYWNRWTTLKAVDLRIRTSGAGQILVYRSNARGISQKVEALTVDGEMESTFSLAFSNFIDGGWYWFDLVAASRGLVLEEAAWHAPVGTEPTRGTPGSTSVAITTLNRGAYCTKLLADIGERSDITDLIDTVYVVDQGTQKIRDAEGFERASTSLGDKLVVIEQANVGGSGGFSRGMYETIKAGRSDYVLLLDDDVAVEPESIRRAVRFADYLRAPAIVGGHMFDMYDRSKLHAYAEGVERWNFMWGPTSPDRHDFARSNLRQTRWLHRRIDSDYNGWWMSLIPVQVLKEVGLSLPVFIKWDDAEYSLRARDAGYPTVTLPGAAVWHVSWVDKDDSQDWQAFYHARNRLVAALLHSPFAKGGGLARSNLAIDLKHLLSMQYFAAEARRHAYSAVRSGPENLWDELPTRLGKVRALSSKYVDGSVIKDREALPPLGSPRGAIEPRRNNPPRAVMIIWLARSLVRHALQPASAADNLAPQAHLPFSDAKWWVVPGYDSVLVSNAEGSGVVWHRRDRRTFLSGVRRAVRDAALLRSQWTELRGRYRAALPELVSVEAWGRFFASSPPAPEAERRS